MSRVIVINQPHQHRNGMIYDVTPATKYGDVEFLFTSDMPNPSNAPEEAVRVAHERLANFDIDNDYLVWAGGDPLGMVIASAVLGSYCAGVKYLRWERARERNGAGYYSPLYVQIFEEEN